MTELSPYVNKTVEFAFMGARLRLELSHALFSSFDVDSGTRLLLKAVARDPVLAGARRVLDAGCGTGVIGLAVAKAFPDTEVTLRDRDMLAVAFARRNRRLNGLAKRPMHIEPGLLGDGLEGGPFDYVLSNLPAKAGATVLEAFVSSCARRLVSPGGRLAFVIVHTLAPAARQWCADAGFSAVREEATKGHCVFVCDARPASDNTDNSTIEIAADAADTADEAGAADAVMLPDASLYIRSDTKMALGAARFHVEGYQGLPEFDTVGYGSALAVAAAEKAAAGCLVRDALFVESGIGLTALWACDRLGASRIVAASRDILSLSAVKGNLVRAGFGARGFEACSSLDLELLKDASFDLVVWALDEIPKFDWITPAWADASRLLKKGASVVFVSTSTGATRLAKACPGGMRILGEKKKKGYSALFFRREG